ncbi:hypothetical protein J2S30_002410 [Herbaspirillum rubrisubalbicans]|nr:hypothetical protein [Herbaspirillum rubrisubalbicans]
MMASGRIQAGPLFIGDGAFGADGDQLDGGAGNAGSASLHGFSLLLGMAVAGVINDGNFGHDEIPSLESEVTREKPPV